MKPYGPLYSNIFNVVQFKHTHTALCYILKNIEDGDGTKKRQYAQQKYFKIHATLFQPPCL